MRQVISGPLLSDPRIFMAVLAAGASRRFGEADKLAAPFAGKMLGEHVCANLPFERAARNAAVVIASASNHPCQAEWQKAGFELVLNPDSAAGMGTSISLAVRLARRAGCEAILIALADMPMVPREHFDVLLDAYSGPDSIVCSSDGRVRMPPAIFGEKHFDELLSLRSDQGARPFLKQAQAIVCPRRWLIDIDTPEALATHGQRASETLKTEPRGD